jgi:hypothetical protein
MDTCLTRLPAELVALIASHLAQRDRLALLAVSQRFHAAFKPLLYRDMRLCWPQKAHAHLYSLRRMLNAKFERHMTKFEMEFTILDEDALLVPVTLKK